MLTEQEAKALALYCSKALERCTDGYRVHRDAFKSPAFSSQKILDAITDLAWRRLRPTETALEAPRLSAEIKGTYLYLSVEKISMKDLMEAAAP